jgi:hypothetical protein
MLMFTGVMGGLAEAGTKRVMFGMFVRFGHVSGLLIDKNFFYYKLYIDHTMRQLHDTED